MPIQLDQDSVFLVRAEYFGLVYIWLVFRRGRLSDHAKPPDKDNEELDSASEILADAVGGVINQPDVTKSIATLITAFASHKTAEPKIIKISMILGLVFSFLIFLGIAVLSWFKVLSGEATTGLLGALIGYWFGQRQAGK
jgi:hypothetical protein